MVSEDLEGANRIRNNRKISWHFFAITSCQKVFCGHAFGNFILYGGRVGAVEIACQ